MRYVTRASLVVAIGSPCRYCGEPMTADTRPPSRDHIRPRLKGGTLDDPRNKAIVCVRCNTDKGSRSLASFLFRLARAGDPRASTVAQFIKHREARM
jgi:5-methylcytosine-specific restriction endonuclease McrA